MQTNTYKLCLHLVAPGTSHVFQIQSGEVLNSVYPRSGLYKRGRLVFAHLTSAAAVLRRTNSTNKQRLLERRAGRPHKHMAAPSTGCVHMEHVERQRLYPIPDPYDAFWALALALAAFFLLLLIITMLRKDPTTAEPSKVSMTGMRMAQTRGGKRL